MRATCLIAAVVLTGILMAAGQASKPEVGANADLHGYGCFPDNDPWNTNISDVPVDPHSSAIIRSIGLNKPLHPDFGTVWNGAPNGIPYYVVGKGLRPVHIPFTEYADESDPGPYPIPAAAPIEGGPKSDGDRHVLVLDPDANKLYELYHAVYTDNGWTAGSGAIFDLSKSSAPRPAGWTSADAAGLPIFPGLVRYDEVVGLKKIQHALRFTVVHSRRAYVPPALHWASSSDNPKLPPMGMRVRLRKDFDLSKLGPEAHVIAVALQTYGMIVADNGSDWFLSGAPDPRWDEDDLGTLRRIKGSDFEVLRMDGMVSQNP